MTNYDKAKALLIERMVILHALAKALLETETLDGLQIDAIVNGAAAPAPAPA
jgi:cell division protease FtsH